jgi:hypothetical protein
MSGDAAVERVSGTGGRAARLAGQVATVFRIELGRNLRSPGAIGLALFALLPAAPPAALWMGHALGFTEAHLPEVTTAYAALFQSLVLRVVLFFGCVLVFTNLVRRELRHRTLHHWLLAPLRREVLLAGKYLAGVATAFTLFGGGALVTFAVGYGPFLVADRPGFDRFFSSGPGLGHLAAYLGIALLATIGYGAVFLALGLRFSGPIVPAILVFGWETIHPFLPPALKKLSVVHYLYGLCPVPVDHGPFALIAASPSTAASILGVLLLAAALLVVAALKFRRSELLYSEE